MKPKCIRGKNQCPFFNETVGVISLLAKHPKRIYSCNLGQFHITRRYRRLPKYCRARKLERRIRCQDIVSEQNVPSVD